MAAASIANIVKSSLGPVGLDKMLVDDIGVSLTCNSVFSHIGYIWDSSLLLTHRMWPSLTMEQPSWSCWKWSTQLLKSCVNWLTCRTKRSEMEPHLWWVGWTAAGLRCWCCPSCWSACKSPVLVPLICILVQMCGYANRTEKLSVSIWRSPAVFIQQLLMKWWHNKNCVIFMWRVLLTSTHINL